MQAIISLILLLMCIAVNAETEVASDYLKSKWRASHNAISQLYSRRCFRTCSSEDVFWNEAEGNVSLSLSESKYVEYMAKTYEANPLQFIYNLHDNATVGTKALDVDNNDRISAEEYYTEMLCLGFNLDYITKQFEILQPMDDGVPNHRFIKFWVEFMTDDLKMDDTADLSKNISSAYNETNHI